MKAVVLKPLTEVEWLMRHGHCRDADAAHSAWMKCSEA
eukprot:CAMPEP_0183366164 /NCGR_PEP_ID=MMETSP0164_2-20130417/87642_1 /TAXON_ID=221442 /ORGANISM="Coccolithus pelagicus ssp braarudi, Strain PLY182g" /LENGTH=37 /DNA_ID= /DNA_START= /DNA_END= /DNA_ORIENTATION=